MLDLHVLYDATGSTSLIQPKTIPSGDGATAAGVPILTDPGKAKLIAWGAVGITATAAIKAAKLISNDLNDTNNGQYWLPSGTVINIMTPHFIEGLDYKTAARQVFAAQKAAGLEFTFTIDHYDPSQVRARTIMGGYLPPARGMYSQVFGGALTAQAWGSVAFAPTYNLPAGAYAILGFWVTGLTNVAALRFQHSDFGAAAPGCIAVDQVVVGGTLPALAFDRILIERQGYQFVAFSEITGQPQCPVFRAGPNGTGLNVWAFDNTADTPTVILNLAFLGGS